MEGIGNRASPTAHGLKDNVIRDIEVLEIGLHARCWPGYLWCCALKKFPRIQVVYLYSVSRPL